MPRRTKEGYQERLNRVLDHMERHLDEELALDALAEVACFSAYHFHRIFSGMVGEGVAAHLRRLRLERAANRLCFTNLPVTDIALNAGYDSPEAFSRAFKGLFELSPVRYRELALAGGLPPVSGRTRLALCRAHELIQEGKLVMEAKVKELPELRVAYVRHVGPYEKCESAWEAVCGWAAPKGLMGSTTAFIGLCHDDPEITPPENIRYDACLTVSESVQAEGPVGVKTIGGGRYAMALHKGPYENLAATYAWLCGVWAAENNQELASEPSLEFYMNDPQRTPPEQLLTEVYVRLT
ncbi:MAG: AraC family transcriptional regulator [Proteobacteria bacterium]|nr:AraC family transcriptional regulator [Pseudomonadota bacterium]